MKERIPELPKLNGEGLLVINGKVRDSCTLKRRKTRERKRYKILQSVMMVQSTAKHKFFVLDRVQLKQEELRLGYYIVGAHGNKKGKWTWGQYCPFIPASDFKKLIKKAKREGII